MKHMQKVLEEELSGEYTLYILCSIFMYTVTVQHAFSQKADLQNC